MPIVAVLLDAQMTPPPKVQGETEHHPDAGGAEAVVPADLLTQCAAHQRRERGAEVDAHVEDRERAVAPRVTLRIQPADLGGDVGLERAVAEDQEHQRREEPTLHRHQEVADGHQDATQHHRLALSQHPVGEHATEERREVHERGVQTIDLRRQRLRVEMAEGVFEHPAHGVETQHLPAHVGVQEQVVDHVQHQQRAHAVVREALPHLGEEQHVQPDRMPEPLAPAGLWVGGGGDGHVGDPR